MLRNLLRFFRRRAEGSGAFAERMAADWLKRERGFAVVVRNWRNPRDERQEIDLVCRDGDVLVFVEVKARAAEALVPGYYAVDARKKRALTLACRGYLGQLRTKPRTFRFDIVEVSLPAPAGATVAAPEPVVLHFENVPLFTKSYRG